MLGFKNYGDEYKVMGMSALGNNNFEKQFQKTYYKRLEL